MARPSRDSIAPAVAPLALFGIDNSGIGVAANLLVVFLIAIWFALVFWTYADSRRRLQDPVLIGSATLAALIFPFAGALVYAIVRPPETLDDAYERELDVRAAELRVRLLESAVKGGPGSSAAAASVAAEVSGEPSSRRGSSAPPSQPRQAQASQPRRTESGRPAEKGSGSAPAQRSGQPQRPSSGSPSRPPATGADGA
ncbi:MAG: hypothetical protein JHC98_07680 [Thermoleophilaceae bacterium]|nr:hypothetical protein [Thermoleophilaceae bacterium]